MALPSDSGERSFNNVPNSQICPADAAAPHKSALHPRQRGWITRGLQLWEDLFPLLGLNLHCADHFNGTDYQAGIQLQGQDNGLEKLQFWNLPVKAPESI